MKLFYNNLKKKYAFFGYYPTRQVPTYFLYIFLKSIFEEVCTKKSFYS